MERIEQARWTLAQTAAARLSVQRHLQRSIWGEIMRIPAALLILVAGSLVGCRTAKVWPHADHIVLGRTETVSLVDGGGNSLPHKTDVTNEGVLIKQTIRTTHVIRTSLSDFPKTFEQLRDPRKGSPTNLSTEREKIGQEWIFGLKGPDLHGTGSMHVPEKRITTEKELEEVLRRLPVM